MAGRLSLSGPRTLALSAFVSALVLAPPAGAATPQGPVSGAPDAVQQAAESVTTVAGGATDAVERTTAQVTQPVTGAVAETTTRATETVTRTVQETVSRATRDVQPAADDVARTVDSVAAGVTGQARDPAATTVPSSTRSQPPGSAVAGPRTRGPIGGRGLKHRPATAEGHRADRPQEHPAGARHRAESGGLPEAGPPVAALTPRPRAALPLAGGSTPTVGRAEGTGSGAPYPDAPPGAEGSVSALSTGLALGGLALLAIVLCLTAPGPLRRLPAVPAARRPALFLYALERPG
jgi:gas vesicle protein